ncbi:MAG TPA: hypothetical protein VMU02_08585 [bacterium]|nr:hypothetical protein [bacterium]
MMVPIGVWINAFVTLCILSFLYKDNPFFRFAESLFAGLSLGYYIGLTMQNTLKPNLLTPVIHEFGQNFNYLLIIPAALGVLLYFRYIPRVSWMARIALAVYVGYYSGVYLLQKLHGEILPQSRDTVLPVTRGGVNALWNIVMIIGVFSVLIYFYFSAEHKGAVGRVSRVGIWFLMISFGASFGYTVMARVSLLMGRFSFLVNTWIRPMISG